MNTHTIQFNTGQYLSGFISDICFDTTIYAGNALKAEKNKLHEYATRLRKWGYKCDVVKVNPK